MENNKRFYWIKLKTDFFNQDTIDFILQQENGCKYIVLYQMLCLMTANNNGELNTKIGEMIIPYDVEKIQRDTKYFDIDTVCVALELFKQLGLVYEGDYKALRIANYDQMIGSETASTIRSRKSREKQKMLQCNINATQEIDIRDKSIDIDKDIDINKLNEFNLYNNWDENLQCECVAKSTNEICGRRSTYNINKKNYCNQHSKPIIKKLLEEEKLHKPSLEEIESYCKERNNNVDAQQFYDFYESKGWLIGKNKMKDWKAAIRTWERNSNQDKNKQNIKKQIEPEWFNQKIEKEELSEEERKELDELMSKYR